MSFTGGFLSCEDFALGCCKALEIEGNGLSARDAGKCALRRCAATGAVRVV